MHQLLNQAQRLGFFSLLFTAFFLIACEDKVEYTRTYTLYEPVYTTPEEIRGAFKVDVPKVMQEPGKIYMYGDYLFVNEPGEGIHVINNADKKNPVNLKFISLPGNYDMAARDGMLYADSYMDLVVLDISDINNIYVADRIEDIFINTIGSWVHGEFQGIITDWIAREQVEVSSGDVDGSFPLYYYWGGGMYATTNFSVLENSFSGATAGKAGVGGSMARFTIVDHHLYTIDYNTLYTFNIQDSDNPAQAPNVVVGWGIETIFPSGGNLFIGAQDGMYIYSIQNRNAPQLLSRYAHVTSCDPVVVHQDVAYVTLRGGTECRGFTNQLDIINVKNLFSPSLIVSHPMQGPYGLGYDAGLLFICEGKYGLKVFDASNAQELGNRMLDHLSDIDAYDVIPHQGVLLLIGRDGLYQYDYSDPQNLKQISKLTIDRKIPAN